MSGLEPDREDAPEAEEGELPEGAEEAQKDLEEMQEEIAPFTERKNFSRESTSGGWRHDSEVHYGGD